MQENKSFLIVLSAFMVVAIMAMCSACGAKKNNGNEAENNSEGTAASDHIHSFSDVWSQDGTYHWRTCSGCEEMRNRAEHDWNAGIITTAPTETTEGVRTFTCNTCGHTKVEPISTLEHIHTFKVDWSFDENYHWHDATCEHSYLKNDVELHNWIDTGRIITVATETTEGEIEQKCSECEHTRILSTGTLNHVHTFADDWNGDEVYHWHSATCGHDVTSEKNTHNWDDGETTKEATVYGKGITTYTCLTCSMIKEEDIPELDSFSVLFVDDNNRTVSDRKYALKTANDKIQIPRETVLDGYRFLGWKEIDSSKTISEFDFSNAKKDDVYYFKSKYEKIFTVVFKAYEYNEEIGNYILTVQETIEVAESNNKIGEGECPEIPNREGYDSHWDPQSLCDINDHRIITPIYEIKKFDVVFKGAEGKEIDKQEVYYGSFAIVPECEPYYFDTGEMKMYEFSGWSLSLDSLKEVKEDLTVEAQYKVYDEPFIALKIDGKKLKISVILPTTDTALYTISFSFMWKVEKGTCQICDHNIRENSPLSKSDNHNCLVGDTDKCFSYNNKQHTFDFVWSCAFGHITNNTNWIEDVLELTFDVKDSALFDESIFTLQNSIISYGGLNADFSELQIIRPMIWFY